MGCTNSAEKESSDKFSNTSAREQGAIAEGSSMHRSQLMDLDWFERMSNDPTGLFDELAKGEGKDKHIDKATALKVANSALVIYLEIILKEWAGRYNDLKQDVSSKASEAIKDKVRLHNTDAVDSIFDAIDTNHNGKIEKKVTLPLFLEHLIDRNLPLFLEHLSRSLNAVADNVTRGNRGLFCGC